LAKLTIFVVSFELWPCYDLWSSSQPTTSNSEGFSDVYWYEIYPYPISIHMMLMRKNYPIFCTSIPSLSTLG